MWCESSALGTTTCLCRLIMCISTVLLIYSNEEEFAGNVRSIYILFFLVYIVFVICHIKRIVNHWKKMAVDMRINLFLHSIMSLIIIFANIYLILIFWDSTTLNFGDGIPKDGITLYFEVVYFSAMTFLTVGCDVLPATIPAKVFVLIESMIFSIGICIIIFGFIDRGRNQET